MTYINKLKFNIKNKLYIVNYTYSFNENKDPYKNLDNLNDFYYYEDDDDNKSLIKIKLNERFKEFLNQSKNMSKDGRVIWKNGDPLPCPLLFENKDKYEFSFESLFKDCNNVKKLDLSLFDTSKVINMKEMFSGCKSLEKIIFGEKFITNNVYDMSLMFNECERVFIDLSNFEFNESCKIDKMFDKMNKSIIYMKSNEYCEKFKNISENISFTLKSNEVNNFYEYENGKVSLKPEFKYALDSNEDYIINGMTYWKNDHPLIDFNNGDSITSLEGLFKNCLNVESIDLSEFKTENIKNMSDMFYNCQRLKDLKIGNIVSNNANKFFGMFYNCASLNIIDLSSFKLNYDYLFDEIFTKCSSKARGICNDERTCDIFNKLGSKNKPTNLKFSFNEKNIVNVYIHSINYFLKNKDRSLTKLYTLFSRDIESSFNHVLFKNILSYMNNLLKDKLNGKNIRYI